MQRFIELKNRKIFTATLIFSISLFLLNFASISYSAESLKNLFWRRAWPEMEMQFNSLKKKTAHDYSLMANTDFKINGVRPSIFLKLIQKIFLLPLSLTQI